MIKDMEKASKYGIMAINMMDNGKMIKEKVKALFNGQMEIYILDSGKMIKYLEKV